MMNAKIWFLVALISYCTAKKTPRLMGSLMKEHSVHGYKYDTIYMDQDLDHFTFQHKPVQYKQRLLINEDHWATGGPIFFYTGNEGDIELFAENTGFMFDIAPKFNACVVFAEHRYYGKSLPFGNDSFASWEKTQYLDVNQVLADYAENILMLKSSYPKGKDSAVIAFGGSYGGMLAAWFRIKYPALVQGSIAASAPVWMFPQMTLSRCSAPYEVITRVFNDVSSICKNKVKQSWGDINQLATTKKGRSQLQEMFKTCKPFESSDDVMKLSNWLNSMYFDMAMVNYPYPTSFLAPLPAWPVKEFCARANTQTEVLQSIAEGSQVYFNYTGTSKCLDLDSDPAGGLGMQAWDFQACLQIILPICSNPKYDMFPEEDWDLKSFVDQCEAQWNSTAKPFFLKYSFGKKIINFVVIQSNCTELYNWIFF